VELGDIVPQSILIAYVRSDGVVLLQIVGVLIAESEWGVSRAFRYDLRLRKTVPGRQIEVEGRFLGLDAHAAAVAF
jgi:hypothetical protein